MKKVLGLWLIVLLVAGAAHANTLVTALSLGKGTWAFSATGAQQSNYSNITDCKQNKGGLSVGYGLTDKLDAYILYGSATTTNYSQLTPLGVQPFDNLLTNYGLILKYGLMNDTEGAPVSLSIAGGASPFSAELKNATLGVDQFVRGSQGGIGVLVSKVFIPFVPYLAYQYMLQNGDTGTKGVETQLSIGSLIAWAKNAGLFVEYTNHVVITDGGIGYSMGEISLSLAFNIEK